MPIWKVKPQIENSVHEKQIWTKDSVRIVRKEIFSWAAFECESQEQPNIDLVNSNGIELTTSADYNWDLIELEKRPGGPWVSWEFPDDMSEGERYRVTYMLDSGSFIALEIDGWERESIEYWFYGPLTLTEIRK